MAKTTVFLGGTCSESTWREELIAMLDDTKVSAFNPVVDDWNEEAQANEDFHKENDDLMLFVLTPEMQGVYSIFEIADLSNKRPNRTVFCVLNERDGKSFNVMVQKNMIKIKKDVAKNGAKVCDSLKEVAEYLNAYVAPTSTAPLA